VCFGDDEILVEREGYLRIVVIGGTLRDNSTTTGGLVVYLAEKVGVSERVGAVA
jgi:hypothetical protein